MPGEREGKEGFGGNQAFALKTHVWKQPGEMGRRGGCTRVSPTTDQAQLGPENRMPLSRRPGAKRRAQDVSSPRVESNIPNKCVADLAKPIDQQLQERRMPDRDEAQIRAADQREQRRITESVHVRNVSHR